MIWTILGIVPTKDKKIITDAYRQKLRQTNPEDKPEEFKTLRSAYEQAMAFADQVDTEPSRDESPVGLWIAAIGKLYDDFASRIDPACWQALMHSDVCIGLDTRPAAEEALLKFLLENYYLPKAVWQVLDETFQFTQRVEELYEVWPKEFIDHAVLSGIRFGPGLECELFTPGTNGKDCDAFRNLYFQANQTPLDEIGGILEQIDGLSEHHPYGDALRYRYFMTIGHQQEGEEGFRALAAAYPDQPTLALAWADLCLEGGNMEEAERIASHILEIEPKHLGAKTIYAKCLAEKKQYHAAKEFAYEIIHSSEENPMLMEHMVQLMKAWNEALIHQREAAYGENPGDTDNAIELAWCYAQNDRVEEAMALAMTIDPDGADAFSYQNLMGKLYHNTGKFAEALPYLQRVETVLRNMTDDGTQETRKRMARLPEMLQIQGNCLTQLGRTADAKEKFQQALEVAPEDTEVLSLMGKILFASGAYGEAVEFFRRLLRLTPNAWVAELMMALCLYRMRQDREAFDAVNRAIAMQGNDLSLYVVKMQILVRNEIFEEVHEILNFLKEGGAPEDIAIDFLQAELTELEKKDEKSALKQYRALQKRVEAGENLLWSGELYYRLAVLTGNGLDISQERNRKTVLELVDKGLSHHAQDVELLSYKAWVLKQGGMQEEAVAMYQALLEKNPESEVALRGLADLYYGNLNRHAAQALTYYEKLLERQKTAELYFYAATCKRHLGDLEGAKLYYQKELEMDPEDIDGFRGLAFLFDAQGKYEASLELLEQALTIMEEYSRPFDPMVEHKAMVLRRLGRFEEALSFVRSAAQRYQFGDALQLQFDICCQAGWWNRAKQVLQEWKLVNRNDPKQMAAAGRLNLLQGKTFQAALAMGPAKHKLPFQQVQDFRLQLVELEQNYSRQVVLLRQRLYTQPNDDHTLTLLALAYWHTGKKDDAKATARKALALLDSILSQKRTDEPLYRGRRSLMLAILGKTEEARAEPVRTRALPLCDFCEYGSCKDADIYEAQIEEILGNREAAQKLYTEGRAKWPDDLDFISGQRRLKKKVKS